MKLYLKIYGVKYGSNIMFYGKAKFIKSCGAEIIVGKNCTFRSKATSNLIGINRPCIISATGAHSTLIIGNNCGLSGVVIGCFKSIKLGNDIKVGANTLITDSDWHSSDFRAGNDRPVFIDDNVWIGEGVKVLKGVSIGKNSVIGAGSVVTKDIPANVIAAGNPCKVIRQINYCENYNSLP
jgi:acetyltransferase-like isoleucine patch superfamily enzyme